MKETSKEYIKPQEVKKLNIIKQLRKYKDIEKIISIIKDFNKKQESDYFLTQNNIKIGKITANSRKTKEIKPFSYVGQSYMLNAQKRKLMNYQNTIIKYRHYNNSNSSSNKLDRNKNKDYLQINKNQVIDNKSLKNYYNEIRQRISEEKSKNEDRNKLLIEVPNEIRKSLLEQENIFKKIMKEKRIKKLMQEKIKRKCNKESINDLLINKSQGFNKKYQEISIIDKNETNDYKYRGNLWNITLRNYAQNGKYEKLGYLNIGNNYEPRYTFFNMNHNLEYFNKPSPYKTECAKNNKHSKDICLRIDDNLYNLKIKQNLNFLNNMQNLEINGKNLLDFEEAREKKIKGNKIMHKNEYLEYLFNKKINKGKGPDALYEEKTYAKNYNQLDFMKNINLNSKCK